MSLLGRSLLIGGILLAAYYALIFGYAWRMRVERDEHVLWRFPLEGQSDLCADPLPNGGAVCSEYGRVIMVGPDGRELASYTAFDMPYAERMGYQSAPFEGYQWIGGTRDSLALISAAKPPLDELKLVALEPGGQIRWEFPIETGYYTSLIYCSPDSIYVQQYYQRGVGQIVPPRVQRLSMDGELLYTADLIEFVTHMDVTDDNQLYVLGGASNTLYALSPEGKIRWSANNVTAVPLYSNFVDGGTVYYLDSSNGLRAVDADGRERFRIALPAASYTSQGGSWLQELLSLGQGGAHSYPMFGTHEKARVADAGKLIYALSGDKLVAVSAAGVRLWTRKLPSVPVALAASPDGAAYVALHRGGLAAYSAEGREKWRNTTIRDFRSVITLGAEGRVFVEAGGELICFAP